MTPANPCHQIDLAAEKQFSVSSNLIDADMEHNQNNELTARGQASKTGTQLMRPLSKSYRSNVIISEPVNCSGGNDILGVCALQSQNFSGHNISIAIIDYEYYVDRLSERELPKNTYPAIQRYLL